MQELVLNLDLKRWIGFEYVEKRMLHIRLYRHGPRYRVGTHVVYV